MDVHEVLQVGDIRIVVAVIGMLFPIIYLLVDAPFPEVLCLCLEDRVAQTVDVR